MAALKTKKPKPPKKRNFFAKAVKKIKPQIKPSGKVYTRKKIKHTDEE